MIARRGAAATGTIATIATIAGLVAVFCLVAGVTYVLIDSRTNVIFETESESGRVRVTERSDGLRSLYIGEGHARQSALYPGRPMHLEHTYTRTGMIGPALAPRDGRILFVGLGGGAMPRYTRAVMPDVHIDAVEIDPVIVDVAHRFFGFTTDPRMTVHIGDGRALIERAPPATWDVIVLDAFDDDEIPYALATRQFLEAVRSRLTPDGVVVSNLWTANDDYASMVATYAAVFDNVRLVRVPSRRQRILVASMADRPLDRDALIRAAADLARRADLGFDLVTQVRRGYETARAEAAVLEDR